MREINKKNLLLFVASIAVIGGAFALQEYRNGIKKTTVYVDSDVVTSDVLAATLSTQDSDNDGLKDWEEELWGMDPHNADTNNNGIPDGKEVTQKIQNNEQNLAKTASTTKIVKKGTQTEEFSKKFFSTYLELRRTGDLDEQTINDIVTQMTANVTTSTDKPVYSEKNITLTGGSDNEIRAYANAFGAIRERYQKAYENNQVPVTEAGPNLEDPKFLSKLGDVSNLYKRMSIELSKIPVPPALASTHIAFLNTYMQSATGLYLVSTISKDPLLAIKGIAQHQEATIKESSLVADVKKYLSQKNIEFMLGDGGLFFETYSAPQLQQ